MIHNKKQERDNLLDRLTNWLELKQKTLSNLHQIKNNNNISSIECKIIEIEVSKIRNDPCCKNLETNLFQLFISNNKFSFFCFLYERKVLILMYRKSKGTSFIRSFISNFTKLFTYV